MSFFIAGAPACPGPLRRGARLRIDAGIRAARALLLCSAGAACDARAQSAVDDTALDAPVRSLGVVTVFGRQPTSLPTQIPATMEGVTREQIEQTVNAHDSEDALKYLPSLLVRKRYIGDYNHAVLSSRASGTGNSARSAIYADGVLLSNYLGNGVGGLSFAPRWNMVTPEEIERVDVMYGPFAAAYPGNSVGAVVAFTTRMPRAFEVHAKAGYTAQPFALYGTDASFRAWESSASVGNQSGALAWRLGFSHTDSHGQPLTFATRLLSAGSASTAGTAVSGAVLNANNTGRPWYLLGTGTEYRSVQDHFKARLAYDLSPSLRLNYLLGVWQNRADSLPLTYLRSATGAPVYSGAININGLAFSSAQALSGADFAATAEQLTHVMQGLTLKSHTQGVWDWELTASNYAYRRDAKRQNAASNPYPNALTGGAGTLADGRGSGWTQLAAKGIWRPGEMPGGIPAAHIIELGVQQDRYALRYLTTALVQDWTTEEAIAAGASRASNVRGATVLHSVYAQDAWTFAPRWKAVLGLRFEEWTASDGATDFAAGSSLQYPARRERSGSPKVALAYQFGDDLVLKASLGRAVRMPTVSELYGATSTSNSQYINDPTLAPERSWTTELTAEKDLGSALARLTYFTESTRDSLYSQTTFDASANKNISRVQNVARIATRGLELAFQGSDVLRKGLDLSASSTFTESLIKDNAGFVVVPGDTLGKRQPNIPPWRVTGLVSQRLDTSWTLAFGARYSSKPYRTLNNADLNGFTYQGTSRFFTTDLRLRHHFTRQWSGALGVDNLNNFQYWNFHPYPQRSYSAELRFDL